LKLSSLFAKYLYQHKKLRLPGIGIFTLDPSVSIPDPTDKAFPEFVQHISYSQENITAPDEDFINFIRTETGKIKPLAESDLDSFLSDGKILLNIGKPFHLDGIGSLQKTREGVYEFKAGEPIALRIESSAFEPEDPNNKTKTFYQDGEVQHTGVRKLLIALGAIAGIVIVIWGGYVLYNRNASVPSTPPLMDSVAVLANTHDTSLASARDTTASLKNDSIRRLQQGSQRNSYKFVIERTANKDRAIRRYNQLLENLADVKIETQDSSIYKLYFVIPSTPADTARIRDSLKTWYGRKRVYVESGS
jgi:hypothetical protein